MSELFNPKIVSISWGKIEVEGFGIFKDCVCFDNAEEWDWSVHGTSHEFGIITNELDERIKQMKQKGDGLPQRVVLSDGMESRIKPNFALEEYIRQLGATLFVGQTEQAVKVYNLWITKFKVIGFFHSTC